MSAPLPIVPEQRERWSRPRPEPVALELPGWIVAIAVVASCHKDAAPPAQRQPGPPPPAPIAAAGDAPAITDAAPLVELLHATPSTIRVSSRVANAKIAPEHIADRDPSTAWNSRTGDLVGAWIDVDVGAAHISELRLVVGHTGKGVNGEDYFTMNPRIRRVSVLRDGNVIAKATLDIEHRDLQTIALPAPASHVRLRVDEVMPGTKRGWRETCVAELEAWGDLPPGATVGKHVPAVDVGERLPDGSTDAIADETAFCQHAIAELVLRWRDLQRDRQARSDECAKGHMEMCEMGDATPSEAPSCEFQRDKTKLPDPWRGVGLLRITHDSFEGASCQLVVATAAGWWLAAEPLDCGEFTIHDRIRTVDITRATSKGNQLEVVYSFRSPGFDTTDPETDLDRAVTCSSGTRVECTPPADVAN